MSSISQGFTDTELMSKIYDKVESMDEKLTDIQVTVTGLSKDVQNNTQDIGTLQVDSETFKEFRVRVISYATAISAAVSTAIAAFINFFK